MHFFSKNGIVSGISFVRPRLLIELASEPNLATKNLGEVQKLHIKLI